MKKLNNIEARFNSPWLFIATLAVFVLLTYLAINQPDHGYTKAERQAFNQVIEHAEVIDQLLAAVRIVESHGDCSAVSKKGARGCFQVMPDTAKKPGLGVRPLRDESGQEYRRFARDYLTALLRRYHNEVLWALVAYNAGIRIADAGVIPPESRHYVNKVMREYAANDLR